MSNLFKKSKVKRIITTLLSLLILISNIVQGFTINSFAADETRFTNQGNIWKGGSVNILGHERQYLYKFTDKNGNYTFCIEEGKHMGRDVVSGMYDFKITDDDIPYIEDNKKMFEELALIGLYINPNGANSGSRPPKISDAKYAAAQLATWAVMRGNIDMTPSLANQVAPHINGNVREEVESLIDFVKGRNGTELPKGLYNTEAEAEKKPEKVDGEDGEYNVKIDISSMPGLKNLSLAPESVTAGFTKSVDGNNLIISYKGTTAPSEIVKFDASAVPELKVSGNTVPSATNLRIYVPKNSKDQAMIAGIASKDKYIYLKISTTPKTKTLDFEPEVYIHTETFESTYNVELEKLDAETGKLLEGAIFEVLSSFDDSQVGDGENGSISASNMNPKPSTWDGFRKLGEVITDTDGKASWTDKRYYEYERIYVGHPEPEYLEVPEATEDGSNADEISAIEEENNRVREQWEAFVEYCEEQGYFHDNETEVARQQMIDDRDETYDNFINLQYKYTFKEIKAREGYILHDIHNDDERIEIITTNASEAGAISSVEESILRNIAYNTENTGNRNTFRNRSASFDHTDRSISRLLGYDKIPLLNILNNKTTPESAATQSDADKPIFSALELSKSYIESEEVDIATDSDALVEYSEDSILDENIDYENNISTNSNADKDEKIINYSLRIRSRAFDDSDESEDVDTSDVEFPEPEEDDVDPISGNDSNRISYKFEVENHRTEGEVHINKRDLELFNKDRENSYGQTQGDGTLEGAVYGLYASTDIVHPDGKTGVVYSANELVAIATTDKNGDASFLAYTEESATSSQVANKAGTWIGHPLILGSYYIKEIARSEGYELSVTGKNLKESNRLAVDLNVISGSGEVKVSSLYHRNDEFDGSFNDVRIEYKNTENGFKVIITGYPENTEFYKVNEREETTRERVVKESRITDKKDAFGNIIYKKASGGELKLDADGNPIAIPGQFSNTPVTEAYSLSYRLNLYPSGTAEPDDSTRWSNAVDINYFMDEINPMLSSLGYKETEETSPWIDVEFDASTNEELATKIFEWYTSHSFYNAAKIDSIAENAGVYTVRLLYDYIEPRQNSIAFYEPRTKAVYIKKNIDVTGRDGSYTWIAYAEGSYTKKGSTVFVSSKKELISAINYGDSIEDALVTAYIPEYEKYNEGDYILDTNGNRVPETEISYIYEDADVVNVVEDLQRITDVEYDEVTGKYTINIANTTNWETNPDLQSLIIRAVTDERTIEVDGTTYAYADYLTKVKGAGASAFINSSSVDEGSYIEFVNLAYPGQMTVYSDDNTKTVSKIVLQRAIKQAIEVTKDISAVSYNENNTYKIHKDPFTVLFGGYIGNGKKYVKGFKFKAYLVSDLEKANLLEVKENGEYDYKKLFEDETKKPLYDALAIEWDKPEKDTDSDLTTITAELGNAAEAYYGRSIMLPYGRYVIVEQVPTELVNKHYQIDDPKEVVLPFVPEIEDGTIYADIANKDYIYRSSYAPEELQEKFGIRFNEESHVIEAHNHDGDFKIYKYGIDKDLQPNPYENEVIAGRYKYGNSENAGTKDNVFFEREYNIAGDVIDYGVLKNNVATMTGVSTAIDGKYSHALVPYSVIDPRYGEIINDAGDVGNRDSGTDNTGKFNFIAFAKKHFENTFYSSKLRIEKLDSETGENIIEDGALFKIYATKRDVIGKGQTSVQGSGKVVFETVTVTGTRAELEARGDVDNITWDAVNKIYTGTVTRPIYDENEQIFMKDEMGNEVGIFKALSTYTEVLTENGKVEKKKIGYIETFKPLGAGTYVLVEVSAPKGYQKSKPIAFEVYKDEVNYYENGESNNRVKADRYQYVKPLTTTDEAKYIDVSKIVVNDKPSNVNIHKVEDGDEKVGDENGLDNLTNVNDKGDLLTYIVKGKKEYLESRGDVENITWDNIDKIYTGIVTKTYDEWSENLIQGSESALLNMSNVKPLYEVNTGYFTGYGIRFDNYVEDATMSLYEGLELKKAGNGYTGVSVEKENGKTVKIKAVNTGNYIDLTMTGKDNATPNLPIYDTKALRNEPTNLYFYDLEVIKTETDEDGNSYALDEKGNRISYVDLSSGMAYTKDDYGKIIAYKADANNNKIIAKSVEVHENNNILVNVDTFNDENNLIKYYKSGNVTYKDEVWKTTNSSHNIKRLPFGAYILEESNVPYDHGYIKALDMGFILRESAEEQDVFYQNDFTKINIAKIDITTKKEIPDATMTLYKAIRVEDESEKGYHLEKGEVYTSFISGYEYDDNGNLKSENGKKVPTTKPHWIDHIPVGDYILEETIVPYDRGYVKAESIEIEVKETGNVQTQFMEDDYTALDIKKYDTKTGEVLDNEHRATLALYKASLDAAGNPIIETAGDKQVPKYDENDLIVRWDTDSGEEVASSGRIVTDEYGDTYVKYNYNKIPISTTKQAHYFITENGYTRFEYLPIGHYVLVEENTPIGYATADSKLITIEDKGHLEKVHFEEMPDVPLNVDFYKFNEKIIKDATLEVYKIDDSGNIEERPAYTIMTGNDGVFTESDNIPTGFSIGDLKPSLIEYIPIGKYILRERKTPYGFLKAEDVEFEVVDTPLRQNVYMKDEIPEGVLTVIKSDSEDSKKLSGAIFELRNKTLGTVIERLITDENGRATDSNAPIGYVGHDGKFKAYIYEVIEVNAPDNYMLNKIPYEFEFIYEREDKPIVKHSYDALNDSNRVKISKKDLTSKEELPGAKLKVYDKETNEVIDEWVSKEQPHYIKGIKPGKYILEEVITPSDGYAKAENIEFEITKNMDTVPYVEMFDDSTKTVINKISGGDNNLLEGAKLELIKLNDVNGQVKEELVAGFVSSKEKGYELLGLVPGNYLIREIEAPVGYNKAPDMRIEIKNTWDLQEFNFVNYRVSGGGSTPVSGRRYISFTKVDDNKKPVVGAEFTFYKADGSVFAKAVSDVNGKIRIERPENGTYTFKETLTPAGYYVNDKVYTLIVSDDGIKADFNLINIPIKEVTIYKKEKGSEKLLSGAEISVTYPSGKIEKFVTDVNGEFKFNAADLGKYVLKEITAPSRYKRSGATYIVEVKEDGAIIGDTVIYNAKNKIGKIVVSYKDSPYGIPKTGDSNNILAYVIALGFASLLGLFLILKKRKKALNATILALAITGLIGFGTKDIYASNISSLPSTTISIDATDQNIADISFNAIKIDIPKATISEAEIKENENGITVKSYTLDDNLKAPDKYSYQGKEYKLSGFDFKKVNKEDIRQSISQKIEFKNTEELSLIPNTIYVPVEVNYGGDKIIKMDSTLVLVSNEDSNEYWTDDFNATISFIDYDAEEFYFGNKKISKENALGDLLRSGKEILRNLNLNPNNYQIDNITWEGKEFKKDGVVYRNANISGRKLQKDIIATYETVLDVPQEDSYELMANYVEDEKIPEEVIENKSFLEQIIEFITNPVLIVVLLIAILLVGILYIISKERRENKGN